MCPYLILLSVLLQIYLLFIHSWPYTLEGWSRGRGEGGEEREEKGGGGEGGERRGEGNRDSYCLKPRLVILIERAQRRGELHCRVGESIRVVEVDAGRQELQSGEVVAPS